MGNLTVILVNVFLLTTTVISRNCGDASDEEFCGSCDFEEDSCGWENVSQTSYSWRRQMANITLIPGHDHTTGSAWAHVMHLDGTEGGDFFTEANLEYSVDQGAALGCQIRFWYHIYDQESSSLPPTSTLTLKMVRDHTERQLLKISGETDGWENATAFIGNQPGGYKLLFSFSPSFMEKLDVMLDDINFEYCKEGEIPAGDTDNLSCDFEKDTCAWYHDYTASLLWERRKGGYNGPTGNGYYMLIEAKRNLNISSAARLISFPQPAGQVLCVSFWYHIFGNSIGSLKFIATHSGEPETVVWMRSGTQGNKWHYADLTFNSDKPIQFIIEAVVGGEQGSIVIDDVVVFSGKNGSCPPERECTFQGSLCGLLPHPSANFSWNRITGESQPANSSGPTVDHTLGTNQGYYLSAQLWSHPVGSRGAMTSAVLEPTSSKGECLMFWYYMEGSGVGELSVYLQTPGSHEDPLQLWTRAGDQGKHWRHGRVTLLSPHSTYQVIFEAIVGDEISRDIAIDDLIVLNDACPPTGFCDFERDFCGWVNNPTPEFGVEWDWLSSESDGSMIPQRDHTTGSALGHFAFFMASDSDKEEIAQLESESMAAVDQACLEMWHCVVTWLSNRPSAITLTVFVSEAAGLRPVWNTRGYSNNMWIRDRVDYSASGPHQIILQARCPASTDESFSLDDVHIVRNMSCDDLIPTTTPYPTTTVTSAPASAMDCTFEEGLCNWVQEANLDLNWTLSVGLSLDRPWDGPQYDHTVGNNEGFFLLINGFGSKYGEKAVISVPVITRTSPVCVDFWYHMLGPSVSNLDLLVQTQSSELFVWTRRGTQTPEWMNAQVTLSMNNIIQIVFSGQRDTSSQGFIAIDDVKVREGACSNHDVCGFDSDLCGFENDVSHLGRWIRRKGTKHHVDHTYGTENGFYMTVTSNSTQNEIAELFTPDLPAATEMCVRFWYWLPTDSSSNLAIHVRQSAEVGDVLWQQTGGLSMGWEVAEVTVSSPTKFNVVFKAVHVAGTNTTVKIDDFSARDGACSPPGSCDFESGQCTWVNTLKEDGHDWVLARGGFHGPPADHTTQTPEGWFLLSSSPNQSHSSVAQVVSEWIQVKDTTSCLTLWYHMDNRSAKKERGLVTNDSGTFRVFIRSGPSEEDLMFHSNSSESRWSRFSQSVDTSKPFQLLIEAETKSRGFIAIDDIGLTPGLCQVNETDLGFAGCSFENGTCNWEDISDGQCRWMRGRNATGNTGPPLDHTLGTNLGWYMAVEPHRGEQMSPATLQSPSMKQASTTCILHFFYNMYGEDAEELNVLLKEGSRTTRLLWLSGNHSDSWQHSEVTIGRIPQDFTILFEASRTFEKPGYIAIDDVDFTNCSLPEPQPQCPESVFTCNNSVCVDTNHVCDFSDDCGDWSDENNCEVQGVLERCSFEHGLCSWAASDVDTPGAEWTDHEGEDAWPHHGPHRDHTQNSDAGHYIIPGTHLTASGQTSEILSKTLLPSFNCTMRFFYFSLNDASGTLSARSRTLQSGSDDAVLWIREASQSYSWQRAEVTLSTTASSKIVFRYELSDGPRGLVALDDVSFSRDCVFDPDNSELPDPSSTSAPPSTSNTPTSPHLTSTAPINPCQDNEFFCWQSPEKVCIPATLQCDYHPDCLQGEDEAGCGPCTFENDQCRWTDVSDGQSKWQRQRASNNTEPPTDHTTDTGYYMRVKFSKGSTQSEAQLESPPLSPSSPFCQIRFHFHISAESAGSLRVLMQQAGGSEAILWSRSHSTVSHWSPEHLPLGLHQQPYKVLFSGTNKAAATRDHVVAVDDISFLNCEKSYQPPALAFFGCSFEDGLCAWVQGAEDQLDWLSGAGPTQTSNTGPAGDHTSSKGKYLYIKSSSPSIKGSSAQLKSSLLPPAGEKGYCFSFWYHMFGATVGSLKMFLQTADPLMKTLVWQKSGNQGDEWLQAQSHVNLQKVHQVILEAAVGGEAGDIAIDDISLSPGSCSVSDLCDFEDGSCNWQQQAAGDSEWIRHQGYTHNPYTGPESDHTTSTPTGHYFYLPSSSTDRAGQKAAMFSPLYPADKGSCVQLWYHMYGKGMGTLNVYQQSEDGKEAVIFSQSGDQGLLWRFAQASLLPRLHPYRIVVEGVKAGPTQEGDMAIDDVQLTEDQCPPRGLCDFENSMCSWSNLGEGVDQGDWLRGSGGSPNPHTGPSVDHTTNSTQGHYVYVDSFVGEWGDSSFLVSDVLQPSTRGHCLTFWYHMYGNHVGTLRVYINNRKMQAGGDEMGLLKWTETGNTGEKWLTANVSVTHEEALWFVFVYQRSNTAGGDVALDDITIVPGSCYTEPPIDHSDNNGMIVGLAVGLIVLAGIIIFIVLVVLNQNHNKMNQQILVNDDLINQNSVFDLYDCRTDGTQHDAESDFSFFNKIYDPSPRAREATTSSTDA